MMRTFGKGLVALAAAFAGLTVVSPPASAAVCGDDGTTFLYDPAGMYFDFTQASATPDRDQPFAAFYDSGGNGPADTPPGPRSNSDTFDDWGALFVGGTDVSNMYFSPDNNACSNEEGGAEHVYPAVSLGGLQVQRKIFVRPNAQAGGLPGARVLDLFTNNGPNPVSTTVQVGDLLSEDNEGDVGSDDDTAVRSSSSGDTFAAQGDQWFVTSDHSGGTTNSDPAIAFVVDGPAGINSASVIQVGGGSLGQPEDNIIWRHQITVAPGETAALMSFVVQADVASGDATQADALARSRALAYESAPNSQLYQGMSAAEIAALLNWNDLQIKAQLKAAKKQPLAKKLKAKVICPEEGCKGSVKGVVKIGGKSFKLKSKKFAAAASQKKTVKLSFKSKTAVANIRKLINQHPALAAKAKVVFTAKVKDLPGTAKTKAKGKSKLTV